MMETRTQRKMRKGTRSCIQCRRRKIRCIFPPDNSKVCSRCSSRGLPCVEQTYDDVLGNENKTLRDRVARLESRLEEAVRSQKLSKAESSVRHVRPSAVPEGEISDGDDDEDLEVQYSGVQAPFCSVLGNATATVQLEPVSYIISPVFHTPNLLPGHQARRDKAFTNKRKWSCEKLRTTLPAYDDIVRTCQANGSWWLHYREKSFGSAIAPESLDDYATRVYASDRPEELGILVAAFARSSAKDQSRSLQLVDQVVIAHTEYAATLTGLECILLQAKCYLDLGQPRRAWLSYRRGLMLAQLMNIHRTRALHPKSEALWWSLYHGDLFVSLLLGLPYGFHDAQLGHDQAVDDVGPAMLSHLFLIRCGKVVGRIIDRNQASTESTWSVTVQIQEEMEEMAALMSSAWWEVTSAGPRIDEDTGATRKRILTQIYFYHVRMHLHLPYMRILSTQPWYEYSRKLCVDSARELVRRYLLLRSNILGTGEDLFNCKTNDFVAFTATIVLLISLLHTNPTNLAGSDGQEDWNLLQQVRTIFQNLMEERSCKMALQCHRALTVLMEQPSAQDPVQVFIPYFGTVTVAGAQDKNEQAQISVPNLIGSQEDFPAMDWATHGNDEILFNEDPSLGWSIPMIDIDDDWSQFLQME